MQNRSHRKAYVMEKVTWCSAVEKHCSNIEMVLRFHTLTVVKFFAILFTHMPAKK